MMFRKFWKKQLKQMRKQKMEVKLTPVPIPGKDSVNYVCYDLEVNCITARPSMQIVSSRKKINLKVIIIVFDF